MTSGDFWFMGGYARFVWPCFALALVVLAWNLWAARRCYEASVRIARRRIAMTASPSKPGSAA